MDIKDTTAIKGLFAIIIFMSHIRGYMEINSSLGNLVVFLLNCIGQLMVVMFLFYSGYGLFYGYNNKENYYHSIPTRRIFKTWFNFSVSIMLYHLLNMAFSVRVYSVKVLLLSFLGWESIGNSNWFVFDILVLYFLTYLSFFIAEKFCLCKKNKNIVAITTLMVLSIVFIFFLILYKKHASWWYNTVFSYFFGGIYYLLKENIDKALVSKKRSIIVILFILFGFILTYKIGYKLSYTLSSNLCACYFACIIVLLTMKYDFKNKLLLWIGKYSFYTYIYMRIPMNIMARYGINSNKFIFITVSLLVTVTLSIVMKKVSDTLYKTIPLRA